MDEFLVGNVDYRASLKPAEKIERKARKLDSRTIPLTQAAKNFVSGFVATDFLVGSSSLFILSDERELFSESRSPFGVAVLKRELERSASEKRGESAESYLFWSWMTAAINTGDVNQAETAYLDRLKGQFSSYRERWDDPGETFNVLSEVELSRYFELVAKSLSLRTQMLGNKWRRDTYPDDPFEKSLAHVAKTHPVEVMGFIHTHSKEIRPRNIRDAYSAVMESDPQLGWTLVDKWILSSDSTQRGAAYFAIVRQVEQDLRQHKSPEKFIELYEHTLKLFLEEREVGETASAARFPAVFADMYGASCLATARQPVAEFSKLIDRKADWNSDRERWLKAELDDLPLTVPNLLLKTGRVDLYRQTRQPVHAFSPDAYPRFGYLLQLVDSGSKTEISPTDKLWVQTEIDTMIDTAFTKKALTEPGQLRNIEEATRLGDAKKIERTLFQLGISNLFTIDPVRAGRVLEKIVDLNIATSDNLYSVFQYDLDKVLKVDPETYLKITKNIKSLSEPRHMRELIYKRTAAEWRYRFGQDFTTNWEQAKHILIEGEDWIQIAGVLGSLDVAFIAEPGNAKFVLDEVLPIARKKWDVAYKKLLSEKKGELFNDALSSDFTYLFGNALTLAVGALPDTEKKDFILGMAKSNASDRENKIYSFDIAKAVKDMDIHNLRLLILEYDRVTQRSAPVAVGNVQEIKTVSYDTLNLLNVIVDRDPNFVLQFVSDRRVSNYNKLFVNRLRHRAVINLSVTPESQAFYSQVMEIGGSSGLVGHDAFISIALALVGKEAKVYADEYVQLGIRLNGINSELDASKKVQNVDTFLKENQGRIAKLMLLYPDPVFAVRVVLETARQHGFDRLASRLELMDWFSEEDVSRVHALLSKRPLSDINQGLLIDIMGLYSSYSSAGLNHAFFETLEEHSLTPNLSKELGRRLLQEFASVVGVDLSKLPDDSLNVWNFQYLPKLFEASMSFGEEDKTMFAIIVKSTMRGEFLNMIDPLVDLDMSAYTNEEQRYITEIRRHNALTVERFAAKNLDLRAFSEGATERTLVGRVVAADVVLQATEKISRQISQNLTEGRKVLGIGSMVIGEVNWELRLSEASKKLAGYLNGLDVAEEKDSIPAVKLVEDIEALIRGSIGSGREAKGAILSPEVANKLRTGNFLRPFKWKEGKLVSISPDTISVANRLRQLDTELRSEMARDPSKESTISALRGDLVNILDRVTRGSPGNLNAAEPRPTISAEINDTLGILSQTLEKIKKEINRPDRDPVNDDSLRLLQDHFGARIAELREFESLAKVIRSHDYNLTLRRWKRSPGRDIFQGNYSSCCVAIEGMNGFAMERYLVGRDMEITEVVDNQSGQTVGQDFEFIGENRNGDLSYCIDNIELAPGLVTISDTIRDNLFDMASEVARLMQKDAQGVAVSEITIGTSYNDVDISGLQIQNRNMRKLGGPMLGLRQYVDTFVTHVPNQASKVLHPGVFHNVVVAQAVQLSGPVAQSPFVRDETYDIGSSSQQEWSAIGSQIMRLEAEAFGIAGDPEDVLKKKFANPNNFVVLARGLTGEVVGYSLVEDAGEEEYGGKKGRVAYIDSVAVDYDHQSTGVNSLMQARLISEAKVRGYKFISGHFMADNGLAQRVIRRATENDTLVFPKSTDEVKERSFYGRPQMLVVTELK